MCSEREKDEEIAKAQSARADMKQHADKLIQGFEKLNDSHAKRAIWELVQNACDLSDNCHIIIDFSNNIFSFTHNGEPFTSNTLICLVKQVSSKTPEEINKIGQFGTGFITTHSFGKRFKITSLLKLNSYYIDINDFLIDRQAKNSDELLDKLEIQQSNVYSLIRKGSIREAPEIKTKFTYMPEYDQEIINIQQAENNLHHYVPIVLALNSSLISVKVIGSDGSIIQYRKGEKESPNQLVKIPIYKNDVPNYIFYLVSDDDKIKVVLPLSDINTAIQIDPLIAKLFLFFPLIGTENWGCNYIIHSKSYAPTEPRDGLHIKSKNEQTKEKENVNRDIIEKASQMIFKFMESNTENISEPLNLSFIEFDTHSNTEIINGYYIELKQTWVEKFKTLKLVETENGRGTPSDVMFLSKELLRDEKYYNSIYEITTKFWKNKLPKKELAQKWTEIVTDWEDASICFVTINMIVEKIQEQTNLSKFDENVLHNLYEYLIKFNEFEVFDNFKLLPNIKGEFVGKGDLKRPINIDNEFIVIADITMPEIPRQFVDNKFEFGLEFNKYSRKRLSEDFNTRILNCINKLSEEFNIWILNHKKKVPNAEYKSIEEVVLKGFISLCSIYPSEINKTNSTRRQIMPHICSFYNIEYQEKFITNVEEDKFDYDYTPIRGLLKIFLFDVVIKSIGDINWVETQISFLNKCLSIITNHGDFKDIFEVLPIFPNQNFKLCTQSELRKEKLFPTTIGDSEFLKETYLEIFHDIKSELILNDFALFLPHENERTGLELSSKLELEFKTNGAFEDILNHKNKLKILQIIQKITNNKEWSSFFPTLDEKKAIIMMAKISDDEVKNDLFSIIGMDDKLKIAKLGELSKNPDLVRIIELGKKAIEEEYKSNADFQFKKKIGIHIENLVREKIKTQVIEFCIKVFEKQDGQDMVVMIGEKVVYFIEVKSRWDSGNSITMSYNQIKNAAKNKECYSLCCVEMCDFNPDDGSRYKVKEVNEILDRILFVNDIGFRIEPLISKAISVENNINDVRLTNEYRGIVPQAVVNTGMDIGNFVDSLVNYLGLI